jgi:hypothetical protein
MDDADADEGPQLVTKNVGVPSPNLQLALITFLMHAVVRRFNHVRARLPLAINTQRSLAFDG